MTENNSRYRELLEYTYGPAYYHMRWIMPQEAQIADMMRKQVLSALGDRIKPFYKGNKLVYRSLSPGCRHCAEGNWSCLFINNKCNADCFFCPSEQNEFEVPTSVALEFRHPESYASYCQEMGIKGASISGGEPFITPKRSLAYLRACKKRLGDSLYFWLYTNGSLAKPEILEQLRDEGLNEIRFNIAAWDYNLKMIRRAVGIIDTVTVETPAIPEDVERMKRAIIELADMGVKHLNLHQLRTTTYNCQNIVQRNYCLAEGPHPAVVESELTALDLMLFAAENDLPIGINYCAFIYRNRYQRAAVQSQAARHTLESWEDLTETGLIRRLSVTTDDMERLIRKCGDTAADRKQWHYSETGKKLFMNMELYNSINEKLPLEAEYIKASLQEEAPLSATYKPDAVLGLEAGKNIHVVRTPAFSVRLEGGDLDRYLELLSSGAKKEEPAETAPKVIKLQVPDPFSRPAPGQPVEEGIPWDEIEFSEFISQGLQEY